MQQIIYERLMNKWEQTGYIGRVFCNTKEKAKRVAYMASVNINNKSHSLSTTERRSSRLGRECDLMDGVQLKIQFI